MKSIIKFSIGVAVIASITSIANAKFEHKPSGQIYLGTESTDIATVPKHHIDSITMLKIHGPYTEWRAGGRLSFGDQAAHTNLNVLVGELDTIDSDRLWLHGKYGLYYTSHFNAKDTIFYYDIDRGANFHFNCDIYAKGAYIASDQRFKENVSPLETSLTSLKSITPVSYNLKPLFSNTPSARSITSEKENRDRQRFDEHYNSLNNDSLRYGFIAQEIKEIYPELVRTDKAGYMYVDYIGMIPILVNAINELQDKVNSLENNNVNKTKSPTNESFDIANDISSEVIISSLKQNAPNPFNAETTIEYSLSEDVANAHIFVYNLQGVQIRKYELTERGNCSLTISASDLEAGMYIYTLIADDKEIDSKRMILTK